MGELTSETTSQTELRARLTEQELADLNARRVSPRLGLLWGSWCWRLT
jgi:hypothetical protein